MAAIGATPKEFGLRVRNHPDGLLVTAQTKLRNARKVYVTFAGTISETIIFRTDDESRKQNQSAAESLISDASRLGSLRPRKGELTAICGTESQPTWLCDFSAVMEPTRTR